MIYSFLNKKVALQAIDSPLIPTGGTLSMQTLSDSLPLVVNSFLPETKKRGLFVCDAPAQNPFFTGREDVLTTLFHLLHEHAQCTVTQTVVGTGGMGKTQVVKEFMYRYGISQESSPYNLIYWIPAESESERRKAFDDLGEQLGIYLSRYKTYPAYLKAIHAHLRDNPGWLLVFDNAPSMHDLAGYLPFDRQHSGHVLITSRDRSGWANVYTLSPFSEDESLELLFKITPNRKIEDTDLHVASEIAGLLSHIPLAVSVAGACINVFQMSFSLYRNYFVEDRQMLWAKESKKFQSKRSALQTESRLDTYRDTIIAAVRVSVDLAKNGDQESRTAFGLLKICAFLSPDDMSGFLLRRIFSGETPLHPDLLDDTAISMAVLNNMSLVNKVRDGEIAMHRLIQLVIQDDLAISEKQDIVLRSLIACQQILEHNDLTESLTAWQENGALISHIQTLITHADVLEMRDADFLGLKANVQMHMGIHFFRQDSFDLSFQCLTASAELSDQLLGLSDADQTKNFLTFIKATQGLSKLDLHISAPVSTDIPALISRYNQIFPVPNPSDAYYMDAYYRLSAFLITQKDYFSVAQERFQVLLGDLFRPHISPYVESKCWISLGFGHLKKNDQEGALSFFMKAFDILENKDLFPEGHPNVVWVYNFIANIHMALNHPDQCKLFLEKTLDACVRFNSQSSYFSMHSHQIEALVGLAVINLDVDCGLAKLQIAAAKEIQEARGIVKFADKLIKIDAKLLELTGGL